eukprot:986607-Pleurochrysis_carterae.AAC.3
MVNSANAAARAANEESTAAVSEMEAQVQRLGEGRIYGPQSPKKGTRAGQGGAPSFAGAGRLAGQQALSPQPELKVANERLRRNLQVCATAARTSPRSWLATRWSPNGSCLTWGLWTRRMWR